MNRILILEFLKLYHQFCDHLYLFIIFLRLKKKKNFEIRVVSDILWRNSRKLWLMYKQCLPASEHETDSFRKKREGGGTRNKNTKRHPTDMVFILFLLLLLNRYCYSDRDNYVRSHHFKGHSLLVRHPIPWRDPNPVGVGDCGSSYRSEMLRLMFVKWNTHKNKHIERGRTVTLRLFTQTHTSTHTHTHTHTQTHTQAGSDMTWRFTAVSGEASGCLRVAARPRSSERVRRSGRRRRCRAHPPARWRWPPSCL